MTKSTPSARRNRGTASLTKATPGAPTMSPINKMRMASRQQAAGGEESRAGSCSPPTACCLLPTLLPGEFDRPRLADDRHLDLAGVVELLLDGPGDVVADLERVAVAGAGGAGDDAQLAAGL